MVRWGSRADGASASSGAGQALSGARRFGRRKRPHADGSRDDRHDGEREGQREDVDDRRIEVEVHDVSEGIASATVRSALYVDLLQLLKTRDGWRIVNVAWRDR
jgi:Putative lumazine-binding